MAGGMVMPLMVPCLMPQFQYFVPCLMPQPQGVAGNPQAVLMIPGMVPGIPQPQGPAGTAQLGSMIPGTVYGMPPSLPVEKAASQPGLDPNALAIQQWNGGD